MKFNKMEIEAVFRQHAIDQWNVPEDAIEGVEARIDNILNVAGGVVDRVPSVVVKVKTEPDKGGGPYRTPGK